MPSIPKYSGGAPRHIGQESLVRVPMPEKLSAEPPAVLRSNKKYAGVSEYLESHQRTINDLLDWEHYTTEKLNTTVRRLLAHTKSTAEDEKNAREQAIADLQKAADERQGYVDGRITDLQEQADGLAEDLVEKSDLLAKQASDLLGLKDGLGKVDARILEAEQVFKDGDSVLSQKAEAIEARANEAYGLALGIINLQLGPRHAMTQKLDQHEAQIGENSARYRNLLNLEVDQDSALIQRFVSIEGSVGVGDGLYQDILNLNVDQESVLIQRFETLEGNYATNSGLIQDILNLTIDEESALAERFELTETTLDGQAVTITQHTQSINGIEGRHGVTIDDNGAVSGYELLGGGGQSEFRINVRQVLIGDFSNLINYGSFLQGTTGWSGSSTDPDADFPAGFSVGDFTDTDTTQCLKIEQGATEGSIVYNSLVSEVVSGERLRLDFRAGLEHVTTNGVGKVQVRVMFYSATPGPTTFVGSHEVDVSVAAITDGSLASYSAEAVAPAAARYVRVGAQLETSLASDEDMVVVNLAELKLRRKINTELQVDGSVTAEKLSADAVSSDNMADFQEASLGATPGYFLGRAVVDDVEQAGFLVGETGDFFRYDPSDETPIRISMGGSHPLEISRARVRLGAGDGVNASMSIDEYYGTSNPVVSVSDPGGAHAAIIIGTTVGVPAPALRVRGPNGAGTEVTTGGVRLHTSTGTTQASLSANGVSFTGGQLTDQGLALSGTKVVGLQATGWGSFGPDENRAGWSTAVSTPTLETVASTLTALINDLKTHGLLD